jgi:hypothetical protein
MKSAVTFSLDSLLWLHPYSLKKNSTLFQQLFECSASLFLTYSRRLFAAGVVETTHTTSCYRSGQIDGINKSRRNNQQQ